MLFAGCLDGSRGRLFGVGFRPVNGTGPDRWVLVVPPLFENLNKSRRTLRLLGQGSAKRGFSCWLVDLSGTANSEGDLHNAGWGNWIGALTRPHASLL